MPALLLFFWRRQPARLALLLLCILQISIYHEHHRNTLASARSFYAPIRVLKSHGGRFHRLIHGQTTHGIQEFNTDERPSIPLSYYGVHSGIGIYLQAFEKQWSHLASIGLGVGSLAAYAREGQNVHFFEIDPSVIQIAQNKSYFTFLDEAKARGASIHVNQSDGRVGIRHGSQIFDVIVADAFHSSVIPTHLLTEEAIGEYLAKLSESGVLWFHISNGHFDLSKLLSSYQNTHPLEAWLHHSRGNPLSEFPATWMVMYRRSHPSRLSLEAFLKNNHFSKPKLSLSQSLTWHDQQTNIWNIWL